MIYLSQWLAISLAILVQIFNIGVTSLLLVAIKSSGRVFSIIDVFSIVPVICSPFTVSLASFILIGWTIAPLPSLFCIIHPVLEYSIVGISLTCYQAATILRFLLVMTPRMANALSKRKQAILSLLLGFVFVLPVFLGIVTVTDQMLYAFCQGHPETIPKYRKLRIPQLFVLLPTLLCILLNVAIFGNNRAKVFVSQIAINRQKNLINAEVNAAMLAAFMIVLYSRIFWQIPEEFFFGTFEAKILFSMSCALANLISSSPFIVFLFGSKIVRKEVRKMIPNQFSFFK